MPLLTTIIEGLGTLSRKKETEKLQLALQKMLDERKINQSTYDNNIEEMERKESLKKLKKTPESKKLPSGVHRVSFELIFQNFHGENRIPHLFLPLTRWFLRKFEFLCILSEDMVHEGQMRTFGATATRKFQNQR